MIYGDHVDAVFMSFNQMLMMFARMLILREN